MQILSLQDKATKPATQQCCVNIVKLFHKYLGIHDITMEFLIKRPRNKMMDVIPAFLLAARRANETYFKQNSVIQMKWGIKVAGL